MEDTLKKSIEIGYRHFDGASIYFRGDDKYFESMRNGLFSGSIKREDLWLTWKSDNITISDIKDVIKKLNCQYIDAYLVHHSCGSGSDFENLKLAKEQNLIRYYGVSNCENLELLAKLKENHDICINQIQARAPKGKIKGAPRDRYYTENFIEECNKLGITIMLFATVSGVLNILDNHVIYMDYSTYKGDITHFIRDINKYYMQKYVISKPNVIMVSSNTGNTLELNKNTLNKLIKGEEILEKGEFDTMEKLLEKHELWNQS